MFEFHMNLVATLDGRGVADDGGAIGIPADRVAAAKNRQRAEALEPRRRSPEPRIGSMNTPIR